MKPVEISLQTYRFIYFIITVSICMSKIDLEHDISPRCFWYTNSEIGIFLKKIRGWVILIIFLVKKTSCACSDGSGLKRFSHWKGSPVISFFYLNHSWVQGVAVSAFLIVDNSNVSLAKNFGLHRRLSGKPIM